MPVKDIDKGYAKLIKRIKDLSGKSAITVGIHGDTGSYEDGPSVLEVAMTHEFGLNGTQRSFLRAWADADKDELEKDLKSTAERIIKGGDPNTEMEKLGLLLEAKAKGFIQDGRVKPSSGGDGKTTLIDTSQLVSSISNKLE